MASTAAVFLWLLLWVFCRPKDGRKNFLEKLGIKLLSSIWAGVRENPANIFVQNTAGGELLTPVLFCNKTIKFGKLLNSQKKMAAELFATGHYARVIERPDGVGLYGALKCWKRPVLCPSMVDKDIFKNIILPLEISRRKRQNKWLPSSALGLRTELTHQEISLYPDNDYGQAFSENRWPEPKRAGKIVENNRSCSREHSGIHRSQEGRGEDWM